MITAWLYIIAGAGLMFYPATTLYRVRDWEEKQIREGKSFLWGWVSIPVAVASFILGLIMFVLGTDAVHGRLPFDL